MSRGERLGGVPVFWAGFAAQSTTDLADGMQTRELRPARFYGRRAHPGDRPAEPAPLAADAPRAAVRAHDRAAEFLRVSREAKGTSRRERRERAREKAKGR